jgi:hypothetical protein
MSFDSYPIVYLSIPMLDLHVFNCQWNQSDDRAPCNNGVLVLHNALLARKVDVAAVAEPMGVLSCTIKWERPELSPAFPPRLAFQLARPGLQASGVRLS